MFWLVHGSQISDYAVLTSRRMAYKTRHFEEKTYASKMQLVNQSFLEILCFTIIRELGGRVNRSISRKRFLRRRKRQERSDLKEEA
jgi:hypothetical protein